MNLKKMLGGFASGSVGRALGFKEQIGKADLGILKVAFLVAALDGEVEDSEYEVFDLLAKKCRGYTPESAAQALDEAMRSAGYLMLLSKRVTDGDLVKAFMREAKDALPNGFAYLSIEDVRRAIVTWIVMGLSDGDYSARERMCIEALRKLFAELKAMRLQQEEERWLALSSDFVQAYGADGASPQDTVELISRDFVGRVEDLVAKFGDSDAAVKELDALIAGKEVPKGCPAEGGTKTFPCANEGILAAQAYLESVCDSPKPAIVMDEIISNIVRCSGAKEFSVRLDKTADGLTMEFVDSGAAFDPTTDSAVPDITASVENRGIGGLGIFMVKKMSKSVTYRRKDGKNVLTVVMQEKH